MINSTLEKEMTPLVSIVVVSYNHSKYIKENLDSIRAQTYKNIELIVADDASKDNSVEIFEKWIHENNFCVKRNYHQQNKGLASTLNECFTMIKGRYVKMIAADDYLHPEAIERSVAALENLGITYGMVFTDIFTVNEFSEKVQDYADYNKLGLVDKDTFRKNLKKGNQIAALSVLLRSDVLKETGPYSDALLVEDYQKWLQVSDKYYIGYIPLKLCYYRLHDANISSLKQERIAMETLLLNIRHDYLGENRKYINDSLASYFSNGLIYKYPELLGEFTKYPFRSKKLAVCLKWKLPFLFYRILNKI